MLIFYVPGIVRGVVDTTVNKTDTVSAQHSTMTGTRISSKIHYIRIVGSSKGWRTKSLNNISNFIVVETKIKCISDSSR